MLDYILSQTDFHAPKKIQLKWDPPVLSRSNMPMVHTMLMRHQVRQVGHL